MQYKQLINALEHGFHVMVKNSDDYTIISPIRVDLCYKVCNEDKSDYWSLPHEALLPVFDEEVEEVTIRISKKSLEALKESGIKIIK